MILLPFIHLPNSLPSSCLLLVPLSFCKCSSIISHLYIFSLLLISGGRWSPDEEEQCHVITACFCCHEERGRPQHSHNGFHHPLLRGGRHRGQTGLVKRRSSVGHSMLSGMKPNTGSGIIGSGNVISVESGVGGTSFDLVSFM